ncbi:MAG TPA: daunorubicin ABC transporter ATP-binding protein [Bdellovibrionales bacterium]|nr:daunorubicin ABC transporter ATP-binding protein [Bdellovibrionales bacterium]
MEGAVIQTHSLCRDYKTYKKPSGILNSIKGFWNRDYLTRHALRPCNLSIGRGQIIGLVGANGAGKTTLLKLLSGLIHPTSGTAEVLGHVPWQRKPEFLTKISLLLGQKSQLWWDLPSADSFSLLAEIYELDPVKAKERWIALAKRLRCEDQLDIQLRRLSLGERMKMEIIGSLLHEPQLLFLDEPTIGLDVVAQETIRDFLDEYVKESQPTIILTSHYMDDIFELADRLLLMSQGSIVFDGEVDDFVQSRAAQRAQGEEDLDFEGVIREFLEEEQSRR